MGITMPQVSQRSHQPASPLARCSRRRIKKGTGLMPVPRGERNAVEGSVPRWQQGRTLPTEKRRERGEKGGKGERSRQSPRQPRWFRCFSFSELPRPKEESELRQSSLDSLQVWYFASWLATRRLGRSGKQIAERQAGRDLTAGSFSGPEGRWHSGEEFRCRFG